MLDQDRLDLVFTRPIGREGVSYQVEASTTLIAPWPELPPGNIAVPPNGDGTETVIARKVFPAEGGRLFLRLRVTPE